MTLDKVLLQNCRLSWRNQWDIAQLMHEMLRLTARCNERLGTVELHVNTQVWCFKNQDKYHKRNIRCSCRSVLTLVFRLPYLLDVVSCKVPVSASASSLLLPGNDCIDVHACVAFVPSGCINTGISHRKPCKKLPLRIGKKTSEIWTKSPILLAVH